MFTCLLTALRDTYDAKLKFGERNRLGKHWRDIQISDPYERFDILKARFLREAVKEGFADEEKVLTRLREIGEFGGRLEEIYAENYKKRASYSSETFPDPVCCRLFIFLSGTFGQAKLLSNFERA
ncbi:hypothetical protein [Methanosarcina barkeri]|uniref:hypothetical protein n=1 Tax=Methanosarcina barkeri TaxID=2208 RepID=UPI000AA328DD